MSLTNGTLIPPDALTEHHWGMCEKAKIENVFFWQFFFDPADIYYMHWYQISAYREVTMKSYWLGNSAFGAWIFNAKYQYGVIGSNPTEFGGTVIGTINISNTRTFFDLASLTNIRNMMYQICWEHLQSLKPKNTNQ